MVTEYRLLGPVQLYAAGRALNLGPGKQRTVFAALLLDAGRPVATETLIDRVWDDRPPAAPRSALYSYITRLRRVLHGCRRLEPPGDTVPAGRPQLSYAGGGYLLDVDLEAVDLHRYHTLWGDARREDCPDERRADLLDAALRLWRGVPLADLSGAWAAKARERLVQQHLDAVLLWAEANLRLGRSRATVGVLRDLVGQHPLVEPLTAKLIEALHAEGRTAEALDLYTATRRRLIDELGIEPGEQLRRLQAVVLRAGQDAAAVVTAPPLGDPAAQGPQPAQLPTGLRGFAGRVAELDRLDRLLDDLDGPGAMIVALWGTAGAGKTALAVHWARRVVDRFPDGQMYVNLRGFQADGKPATAEEALRELLDGLGVAPERIPANLPARAALYRSLLAGKRVLIVLDNAAATEQVRALLPGSPGSLVLVTSRNQLTDLVIAEGARPMTIDVLQPEEARQLLANRLGAARLTEEPEAVAQIIQRCAGLPLTLAIVAARAAINPEFSLAAIAGELRSNDLDPFTAGIHGVDLRTTLSWSYRSLRPAAARLFRLLALHPGPDLAVPVVASLLGRPAGKSRPALAELTGSNLVHEHRPGRFTFHDLLRAYARELVSRDETASERHRATGRLLGHYVQVAHVAAGQLDPHRSPPRIAVEPGDPVEPEVQPHGYQAAEAWLIAEHPVLVAAVVLADQEGFDAHAWHLAWALTDFLDMRGHLADLSIVQQAAMAAARRLGDQLAQAFSHRILGRLEAKLGRYSQARVQLVEAAQLYAELGDFHGGSLSNLDIGWTYTQEGQPALALQHALRALELARTCGHAAATARALNAVGWCSAEAGEHEQALSSCLEAIGLLTKLDDRHGVAATQDSLGYAHHCLGQYAEATAAYCAALEGYRQLGDRFNEGLTLTNLADNHAAAGDVAAARRAYRHALVIFEQTGHPHAARVRAKLAAHPVPAAAGTGSHQLS